jgi:hypothetical protein
MVQNLFPKWSNFLPTAFAAMSIGGVFTVVGGVWYYFTPNFWEVGYMPVQPGGGFNHQLHTGKLGMDCRYCHTKVEVSPEANIPNVATCIGCHADGRFNKAVSERIAGKTQFLRDAYDAGERYDEVASLMEQGHFDEANDLIKFYEEEGLSFVEGGESIAWRRVHKLPDYVRNFPHNVHVNSGVSCFSCHGQITGMPEVYQNKSLSMSWCLSCHRDIKGENAHPEAWLVPKDRVTDLKWVEDVWMGGLLENRSEAAQIASNLQFAPPENCGACHY